MREVTDQAAGGRDLARAGRSSGKWTLLYRFLPGLATGFFAAGLAAFCGLALGLGTAFGFGAGFALCAGFGLTVRVFAAAFAPGALAGLLGADLCAGLAAGFRAAFLTGAGATVFFGGSGTFF